MITLQTLGGVRILGESGQPVALRSRKHTGLLLLLAGGDRRVYARSRLCELFWSTSESRARHSLSQAIYDLNQRLGPIVVRGTGEDVSLNSERLVYDVHIFETAVKQNDLETAVQAYRGPFADNLVAAGTPDFERWLDSERTRLARLGEVTLRRFVDECETRAHWGPMCLAALKLITLAPFDEQVHQTYMRALWLHGDGASALRHYRSLVEGGENGPTRFSEETMDLVRRIESRPRAEAPVLRAIDREPPFVGRETEFKALRGTVERIHETRTTTIVVSGEAGIGKSRLVKEFCRSIQVEPLRILASRCYQAEEDIPYTPIVDALAPVASEYLLEQPEIRTKYRRLAYLLPDFGSRDAQEIDREAVEPSAWKRQVYEDVASFVATVTEASPLVWIVDDVQWIDRASAGLLHYLSRRLSNHPFLLVITVRNGRETDELPSIPVTPPKTGDGATHSIPLRPLSEEQISQIVEHARPDGMKHPAAELAVRLSAGNPYYALEVLEAAAKSTEWAQGACDWDPLNDDRLRKVLDIRVSGLGAERLRLLQAIGILERHARPRLVATVAGVGLDEAARLGAELYDRSLILDEEDRIAFTNDAMREFVYSEMTAIERAALHLSAGHALEAEVDATPGTLATHFYHGDEWPRAFGYAMEAARHAQTSAGHSEAAHFAGISARIAPGKDERRSALNIRAESLFAAGDLAEAAACYEAIIEIGLPDAVSLAETKLKLAATEIERCNWVGADEALSGCAQATGIVTEADSRLYLIAERATLALKHATRTGSADRAREAGEAVDSVLAEMNNARASDKARLAILTAKAIQVGVAGSSSQALEYLSIGEPLASKAGTHLRNRFYTFRGVVKAWMADWDGAEADFQLVRTVAEETADRVGLATQWNNLACVALERGEWALAEERLQQANRAQSFAGAAHDGSLPILLNHANLLFYQGYHGRAAAVYESAAKLCQQQHTKDREPEILACLGLIALQRQQVDSAIRHWQRMSERLAHVPERLGTREQFKVAWFTAVMTPGALTDRSLLCAANSEMERDFSSYLKLKWLDAALTPAADEERDTLRRTLRNHQMGWFCHVVRRWMTRVGRLSASNNLASVAN